jgi:hypothetical protein
MDAAKYLYYVLFAVYVDFCICDVIDGTSMFVDGLQGDIRQLEQAQLLLRGCTDEYVSTTLRHYPSE